MEVGYVEFRRADGRALTIARRPLNNEVILRHIDYSLNLAEGGSVHGQRQGYNPHALDDKSTKPVNDPSS